MIVKYKFLECVGCSMKELFAGHDEELDPFGSGSIATTNGEIEYDKVNAIDPDDGMFGVGDGVYCPAFSVLMGTVFASPDADEILSVGDRRLTWWEDDSVVPPWKVSLINPLTWSQSNPVPDDLSRDVLGMDPEEMFVFADSGGFQVKSFPDMCVVDSPDLHSFEKKRIAPEKLLEWQAKNATAGAILDFSPYIVDSNQGETEGLGGVPISEFYDQLFKPNLEQTIENATRMYEHKKRIGADGFMLYNVLHGTVPFDQSKRADYYIREWYDAVDDIGDFDGWGIGAGSTNIAKLALNLVFVSENIDESHLHFFGTGSLAYRAILEYWRLHDGENYAVTSDSTSFEVGSQYRQFFNPLIHGNDISVSQRSDDVDQIVADVTPCTCAVCSQMERVFGPEWIWSRDDAQVGTAINMHNLNLLLQRHRMVQALVQGAGWELPDLYKDDADSQPYVFWKIFHNIFSDENVHDVLACMKFIKRGIEDGMDAALDDFVFQSAYSDKEGPLIREKNVASFMEW